MATRRFHVTDRALASGTSVTLRGALARHIGTVLRLREGDALVLFDGRGGEFDARISGFARRDPIVEIGDPLPVAPAPPVAVRLGVAIAKGAHMDLVIQKATELGVAEITPLASERSSVRLSGEREERKVDHWREIAVNSCEQCARHYVPVVTEIETPGSWMARAGDDLKLLLHPYAGDTLAATRPAPASIAIASGPEGGFTEAEIAAAMEQGFHCVRIGPRILRAETAPIVALALVQYLWGDFAAAP